MKYILGTILLLAFVLSLGSAALAQGSGTPTGGMQCFINGQYVFVASGGCPSSGNGGNTRNSTPSYDNSAAEAEAERERQAAAERQRQREAEEQRLRDEEAARQRQAEFERKKQEALHSIRGISENELGLKGGDAGNLGLKDTGAGGLGLRDISNSNSSGAPLTPEPLQSIPAKVLERRQPDVVEVDRKIGLAQEALRLLIRSNGQSEEQRMEWMTESLDASQDAQKLGLNLLLDLVGAHADYLAGVNKEERSLAMNQLMNRTEAQHRELGMQHIYGMLVNRKVELERIQNELKLAGKELTLREKLADLKKGNNSELTREDMYEFVSQIKDGVEVIARKQFLPGSGIAGPAKGLLDSAYLVWKQADSVSRLWQIRGEQEKSLQAANSLRCYIVRLEIQKGNARADTACQPPAKPR